MAECTDLDECDLGIPFCGSLHCLNSVGSYSCGCRAGFKISEVDEKSVCTDIDECLSPNACPTNSSCSNFRGGHDCFCHSGYENETCSDIDECSVGLNECDKDAYCLNTDGAYNCSCKAGFVGSGKICQCPDGFQRTESDLCVDKNECLSQTDQCDDNAECLNAVGSYTCSCIEGYYGTGRICAQGQCKDSSCPENQVCVSSTSILCKCKDGFEMKNATCVDVDECSENQDQCHKNAKCLNVIGTYNCFCEEGFVGNGQVCNEGQCDDKLCPVTENKVCAHSTSTSCDCIGGYQKVNSSCIDINECASNLNVCPETSQCRNEPGGYSCACLSGFEGDNCTNIDECKVDNKCKDVEDCIDNIGGYQCECKQGFKQDAEGVCVDRNECDMDLFECPKMSSCINSVGSYSCKCKNGFKGKKCKNINECLNGAHKCGKNENCLDTNGNHECQCKNGFNQNDKGACVDIDECSVTNSANFSCHELANCFNTFGSYNCECPNGFEGSNCTNIDECQIYSDRCEDCADTIGSYKCGRCASGYQKNANQTCFDQDECALETHSCQSPLVCYNLEGSYTCKEEV